MNILFVALFAATGAASLIYLTAWWQMLQFVIGSTPVATAAALGGFTAGMFLGIVTMPRIVSARQRPAHLLATIELGIAGTSLAVLGGLRYVDNLHGLWLRAAFAAVLLLPSAFLTGAMFGLGSRWSEMKPSSFLYASAFLGAAAGCVLSSFYLLRVYDVAVASAIAAGVNLCAAALAVSRRIRRDQQLQVNAPEVGRVWISIGPSGCAALAAYSIWARLLSIELATSIHSFPLILSVLLLGLAIGSFAGMALARRSLHRKRNFAICQILSAACVAWSAYMLIDVLPYWPIDPTLTINPWVGFQIDLFRLTWVVLPVACMWGASLPLAAAAAGTGVRVHSAGLLGASIGAIAFGLLLIPWFGTMVTQQLVVALSIVAAAFAVAALPKGSVVLLFTLIGGAALIIAVSPTPAAVIAYGPSLASKLSVTDSVTHDYFVPRILAANEGSHYSLAVSETSTGIRSFHRDGRIQTSTARQDIRLHRMLGHLSGLLHPRPRSVLIAGLGAALTAGSLVNHPTLERIVICEIEPGMAQMIAQLFSRQNSNVIDDSRLQVVQDDARHYLLTTQEKFDIITSEPTRQLSQIPSGILTGEYFELVKRHLNPGGIFAEAVPLHQNSEAGVKSSLATFFEAFPDATVWSHDVGGKGYDLIILGGNSPIVMDIATVQGRLNHPNHVNVLRSLKEAGFPSAIELLATYEAGAPDLVPWLRGAEINHDRNLRLQYLAAESMNRRSETAIYDSMTRYRQPLEAFTGPQDLLEELSRAVDARKPRVLSGSQAVTISNVLRTKSPRRLSMSVVLGDQEALHYAAALRDSIAAGGWEVGKIRQSEFSDIVVGLQIFVGSNPPPPEANELFQALRGAGFTVEGNFDPKANPNSILLVVGAHP